MQTMNNLMQRIDPTALAKIREANTEYPTIIETIEAELESKQFIHHLSLSTAMQISFDLKLPHDYYSIYKLFKP